MLRDRATPVDLFALVPALALAFAPVLARLDQLLDDDTIFQAVKADLVRRLPLTRLTGRPSTPVAIILRLLIVKRLYGWSSAQTEHFVGDSLMLRQCCRLGSARLPDDTTLLRWARLIQPVTLQALLDHVVTRAHQLQVTRGRKLRVDSTVVQTAIHHPTASSLLVDSVRTLGRLLRRARPAVAERLAGVRDALRTRTRTRTRTRSARRHLQTMHRAARSTGGAAKAPQQAASHKLCRVARQVVLHAEQVQTALVAGSSALRSAVPQGATEVARVLPLLRQVIAQAERRVLGDERVPATEQVVSLVEPHTAIITRHKAGHTVEFGRKRWLGEVEGGIVTDVQVREGAPPDSLQVLPRRARHRRQFGRPPDLLTGDRGGSTPEVRREAAVRPGACAGWRSRTPASRPPAAGHANGNGNGGLPVASGGEPVSKGGSACSNTTRGWTAAPTMATSASTDGRIWGC